MTTRRSPSAALTAADLAALDRLAVLDSASPPTGDVLLAEVGDELWAAVAVDTGAAIADPFRPSARPRGPAARAPAERARSGAPLRRLLPRVA